MSRLIDADALKELIAANVYPVCDVINSRDYGMFWTGGIEKAIDEATTVDVVDDLVKAFCEDGTWLERQGVYTLTLVEAKQRAVDIIESVMAKDEPQTERSE